MRHSVLWTVKWDPATKQYVRDPPNQEPYNFVWSPQVGGGGVAVTSRQRSGRPALARQRRSRPQRVVGGVALAALTGSPIHPSRV